MSHHIYHTEALIIGSLQSGEGDRLIYCYTRDHGLVLAHARSIRESRSRLRYALQTFSHAYIDLIRGKYGWKLISATPITSQRALWGSERKRRIIAGHMQLARRLIQGEEVHTTLFDDLLRGYEFIKSLEGEDTLRDAELLLAVRLLSLLGYWGEDLLLTPVLSRTDYDAKDLAELRPLRSTIIAKVNAALHSSQL